MPIVFVHGVNTRLGPSYDAGTRVTEQFARKHLGGAVIGGKALPASPQVTFPFWGDLGATFAWNMGALPRAQMQALGGSANVDLQPLLGHIRDAFPELPAEQPLLALARKRLSLAVDVLNDLALQNAAAGQEHEVADFVVAASAFAEAHPQPAWLAQISTDEQLIARLKASLTAGEGGVEALGGGFGGVFSKVQVASAKLKQAVGKMADSVLDHAGDFASTKLLASTRDSLNANLGRFFGDVFIYFNTRGDHAQPGAIPSRVIAAFDAARAAAPHEPLVILGHSLGGVISFDVLGHFRPDIEVDLFISVGSQVGHFEELKLYKTSDKTVVAPAKAATPPNIRRWINVFDEVDIFSYSIEKIFQRFDVDAPYDTQTYMIKAHSAYFEQERFWQRLRARIGAL